MLLSVQHVLTDTILAMVSAILAALLTVFLALHHPFVLHVLVDFLLHLLEYVYLVYLTAEFVQELHKVFVFNVDLDFIYLLLEAVLLALLIVKVAMQKVV